MVSSSVKDGQSVTRASIWLNLSRVLFALALILLMGYLLIYVNYAIGLMRFPFDYDQGEGFELVDTMMFSRGEWPYQPTEVYPYYASNYPPLFHVILVPFAWVFGPEYWYGRLVGFLGTLVTAGTIGWIVYREEKHSVIATLSGLAFLASNVVYHVGPLFRQHMFMVMFETLAVALLAHVTAVSDQRRRRAILIAGLALLLAAGYTKQLAIVTCAAVFIFLFLRRPRLSLGWGVLFAAAAGLLFVWIDWATGGEWYKNIIAANVNTYFPQQFVGLFEQWLRLHWALVIPAALLALYELYFTRLSLYTVWWVVALASTVSSGKWGAGDSYFATAIAATCVLAGIFAARSVTGRWQFPDDHPYVRRFGKWFNWAHTHRDKRLVAARVLVPIAYLLYGVSVLHMPTEGAIFGPLSRALGLESSYGDRYAFYDSAGWTEGYATIGHVPTQHDIDQGWRIVDILQASDKPAMSEEAGFSLRAGLDVITNPTQLKNLFENDLYDPANLVNAIQSHEFGTVVFRAQFYPPPVLDAVYAAYYPAQTIPMNGFNYEIWQPGPPLAEREAFARALDYIRRESGETTLSLTLPVESAAGWLPHILAYHAWQTAAPLAPTSDACQQGTFTHTDGTQAAVTLCPDDSGAQVRLASVSD